MEPAAWQAVAKPQRARRRKKYLLSYLFLAPSFLFVFTFLYYPVGSALFHSFTQWNLASAKWIGLDNFERLFSDRMTVTSMWNQVVFTITDLLKNLIFPLVAAELIYLLPGKFSKYVFRTGFIIPMLVPGIVAILLWLSIYDPTYGLLNQFLAFAGLEDWSRAWLGDSSTAIWAVVMVGFPFISGLFFLILYAAIGSFNNEMIEAARMDGAKGLKLFAKIHLPLLIPQFKVITILTIIGSLQDFVKMLVLTKGGPGVSTVIPSLTMYTAAFESSEYGYAAAIGTCLFLLIIALTLFNMKIFKTDY
ncbi:carbohydrate ABC transporter permease [Cohnella sp.]|uniref:carbohydrate ABC transporter permease n=1 Tax=Cohnella sp. TaxID=1883426 RepID=UPI003703FB0E